MGLFAEFCMQIASEMLALEVVGECHTCLAYRAELAAAFCKDLVLVLLGKRGFGSHGSSLFFMVLRVIIYVSSG